MTAGPTAAAVRQERYELVALLGAGGMGSVHLAVWRGAAGFARLVAVKKAHAQLMSRPDARASFVREARLAAAIRHANVVTVLDVEEHADGVLLVLEYVEGASLADLCAQAGRLPAALAGRIVLDVARGLHAAHETLDAQGRPLGIVHRDVSPHNVLVGRDGVARIADFGVARAARGTIADQSDESTLKGKLAYMAPEYLDRGACDRRADVFSLGVVAWEAFVGQRLFRRAGELDTIRAVLSDEIPKASLRAPDLPPELDEVLSCALARDPDQRFATCRELAEALEHALYARRLHAPPEHVSALVTRVAGAVLAERRRAAQSVLERRASAPILGRADDEATAELDAALAAAGRAAHGDATPTLLAPAPAQQSPAAARRWRYWVAGAFAVTTGGAAALALTTAGQRPAGLNAGATVLAAAASTYTDALRRSEPAVPAASPARPPSNRQAGRRRARPPPRPSVAASARAPAPASTPEKAPPNPYRPQRP